jgi:type IV pilus assembly protein PilA
VVSRPRAFVVPAIHQGTRLRSQLHSVSPAADTYDSGSDSSGEEAMFGRLRTVLQEEDRGFTLIELLVVIIIIGILSAISISLFLAQRKKGYEASMRSDLRNVANQFETYFTDAGTYPATFGPTNGTLTIGSDKITLSPGDSIENRAAGADPGTYCLRVTSTQSNNYVSYDSDQGGLLPLNTPCS